MPFDNKNLFKPIDVTVDPCSIITGTSTNTKAYVYTSSVEVAPLPEVKEVIFSPPATIVYWKDGTRTVVKCSDDDYFDEETGFVLCFMKKILGNKGNFNTYIRKSIKNAKRYYSSTPLIETPIVKTSEVINTLADKIKEILMPQHGMDKGSL